MVCEKNMSSFTQGRAPLPLEAFLTDPDSAAARPGGIAWSGIVASAGTNDRMVHKTPSRVVDRSGEGSLPPLSSKGVERESKAAAAAERSRLQTRAFRASLPTGRHLFFVDGIRELEHYFVVDFELAEQKEGKAFFAFHDKSRRVRRAVNLDRDALSHAFNEEDESQIEIARQKFDIVSWHNRLELHLKRKHYPSAKKISYIGTGHMANLGELYIHSSREDLVQELRADVKNATHSSANSLECLDLSLMLDILSIKSPQKDSSSAASTSNIDSRDEEIARRPTTVATLVLVFDTDWNIMNSTAITSGVANSNVAAVSLEQTGAKSSQLWLDDDHICARWGGASESQSSTSTRRPHLGPSAPDPGFYASEAADMVLSSMNGLQRDWCGAVLQIAESTLKNRTTSKY